MTVGESDARTRAHSKSFPETVQTLLMNFARSALGVRCVFASLFCCSLPMIPHHLSQTACRLLLRPAIQIALQNHLCRYLIHVAAGFPRFLSRVTQCP